MGNSWCMWWIFILLEIGVSRRNLNGKFSNKTGSSVSNKIEYLLLSRLFSKKIGPTISNNAAPNINFPNMLMIYLSAGIIFWLITAVSSIDKSITFECTFKSQKIKVLNENRVVALLSSCKMQISIQNHHESMIDKQIFRKISICFLLKWVW